MKNMEHGIKKNQSEARCLLRSDRGRPVVAYVADFDEVSAAVKPTPGEYERPLWLKRDEIFEVEADTLRRLARAYETGDAKTLSSLWGRVKLWEPTLHTNKDAGQ